MFWLKPKENRLHFMEEFEERFGKKLKEMQYIDDIEETQEKDGITTICAGNFFWYCVAVNAISNIINDFDSQNGIGSFQKFVENLKELLE